MPRPPPVHCPMCHRTFPDIWAYKAHQDGCVAASRAARQARAEEEREDEGEEGVEDDGDEVPHGPPGLLPPPPTTSRFAPLVP